MCKTSFFVVVSTSEIAVPGARRVWRRGALLHLSYCGGTCRGGWREVQNLGALREGKAACPARFWLAVKLWEMTPSPQCQSSTEAEPELPLQSEQPRFAPFAMATAHQLQVQPQRPQGRGRRQRGVSQQRSLRGREFLGNNPQFCWDPAPERLFSSLLLTSAQTSYTLVQLKTLELSQAEKLDRTV